MYNKKVMSLKTISEDGKNFCVYGLIISIVKIVILTKTLYKFNSRPIKILNFLTDLEWTIVGYF